MGGTTITYAPQPNHSRLARPDSRRNSVCKFAYKRSWLCSPKLLRKVKRLTMSRLALSACLIRLSSTLRVPESRLTTKNMYLGVSDSHWSPRRMRSGHQGKRDQGQDCQAPHVYPVLLGINLEAVMKKSIIVATVISAFALGSVLAAVPASAQQKQKTVAACQAEWRANKADNQAKGITEKAYVAQCRGGSAASAATGATNNAAPSASAAPAASPTPPSSNAKPGAGAGATGSTRSQNVAAPTAANQFASEGQARLHCPADTVVWANLPSHIYHFAGTKNYGNTKQGAYMCERDATDGGFRASKTEKHPS
jgi:hypothetical protein